jgi:hypothetical protein
MVALGELKQEDCEFEGDPISKFKNFVSDNKHNIYSLTKSEELKNSMKITSINSTFQRHCHGHFFFCT